MKILVVLSLVLALSWASTEPRKQATADARRRHEHAAHHKEKHPVKKTKHGRHHGLSKVHRKLYKKFAMLSMPSAVPLENPAALQYPVSQPAAVQQVIVPFTRPLQSSVASSYSSTPEQPSQLGTEVTGDQTVANPGGQPAIVQFQGGQPGAAQPMGEVKTGTQGTAAVAQTGVAGGTQTEVVGGAQTAGGAQIVVGGGGEVGSQAAGGAETAGGELAEAAGGAGETIDPNAGSSNAQSFVQAADTGKEDGLQMYNGGGVVAENEQVKPRVDDAISPQEEVKVVNLGDDDKTANQEDSPCGGCPMNAKCVVGQCQIREVDAQTQGLTGKGSASNPGTVGDIHNLESQELKTLLKEATTADPIPGGTTEAPAGLSGPTETQDQEQTQDELQEQQGQPSQQRMTNQQADQPANQKADQPANQQADQPANQKADQPANQQADQPANQQADQPANQQADQLTTPRIHNSRHSPRPSQQTQRQPQMEPRFSSVQVKELRDFARMYKMYQFIRKMEERINDPDCAPICRKVCKGFCPAKCCRHHHGNTTLKTVAKVQGMGGDQQPSKIPLQDENTQSMTMNDDDTSKAKDEDAEMDEKVGKKHVFVNIVKNNVLDKPRRHLRKT